MGLDIQLENILGQISTYTGGTGLGSLTGFGNSGSGSKVSIWNIATSIEQVKSGNAQAKVNGIMNLVDQAINLIEKIANLQVAAKKEVESDAKEAEELNKQIENEKAELNNSMFEISEGIQTEAKVVDDAKTQMEKAKEDLAKKQEQINAIIKEIENKQTELAKEADPEKQKELLQVIYGLGLTIAGLTAGTVDIQEAFDEASENVLEAYANIETLKGFSVEIQENGEKQIVQNVQQATEATADTVQTQVSGATDIATGEAIVADSVATNIIPGAGAIISVTAAQKGQEYIKSGTTKTIGSGKTLLKIAQGIGGLNDNATLLSTFENAIGGALKSFDDLIGGWNTTVEPLITSLGTLGVSGNYALYAQGLAETVLKDQDTIAEYQEQNQSTVQENEQTSTQQGQTTIADNKDKKPKYELKTPEFKFGI